MKKKTLSQNKQPSWIRENLSENELKAVFSEKNTVRILAVKDGRYFELGVDKKNCVRFYKTESEDGRSIYLRYSKKNALDAALFFSLYEFFDIDEIDYDWEFCHGLEYAKRTTESTTEETFFDPKDAAFCDIFWQSDQKGYIPDMCAVRRCSMGTEEYLALKSYTSSNVFWECRKEIDTWQADAGKTKMSSNNKGGEL